jgi:hypothetical protein
MSGTVHIFRLETPDANVQPEYQVNYDAGDVAYSKVYTERKLKDVLRYYVHLGEEQVERVIRDLRRTGKVTLAGIELTSEEIAGLEMEPVPID